MRYGMGLAAGFVLWTAACQGGERRAPAKPFAVEEGRSQAPAWSPALTWRDDGARLFSRAPASAGDVQDALLICQFEVPQIITVHGALIQREAQLDPAFVLRAPGGRILRYPAGFNVTEGYFAIPRVTLAAGDAWSIALYDQGRMLMDAWAATLSTVYHGALVFSQASPRIQIECRALAGAALDSIVEEESATLRARLDSARAALAFDSSRRDGGFAQNPFTELIGRAEDLAALVGWQDPRVQEARAAVDSLLQAWDERARAAVVVLTEKDTPARSLPLVAALRAEGDGLALSLQNTGTAPLSLLGEVSRGGYSDTVAVPEGDSAPTPLVTLAGYWSPGEYLVLAPGAQVTLLLPGENEAHRVGPRFLFLSSATPSADGPATITAELFWLPVEAPR